VILGLGKPKTKKRILSTEQIGQLLEAARQDHIMGIYYGFPFLTRVRISEQLALLWPDVDTIAGVITIRSMQEINGTITSFTKTAAGMREIPIAPMLLELLNSWKDSCPTFDSGQGRVFPSLGRVGYARSRERPLTYANYLTTYWHPALKALGLPPVSPHSARHAFISNLQAQGIEVGLVSKLAGHASVSVTLSHYTQAVRGGGQAVASLEQAYRQAGGLERQRTTPLK
jgi:integrase